ncbi:hypothetical protein T492DRAFT_417409 [Pavlovales sp. CCMP2436]|nr:hypothetical protein T492DRAFT_417409 [Pavlovales sp. CCMP2436]
MSGRLSSGDRRPNQKSFPFTVPAGSCTTTRRRSTPSPWSRITRRHLPGSCSYASPPPRRSARSRRSTRSWASSAWRGTVTRPSSRATPTRPTSAAASSERRCSRAPPSRGKSPSAGCARSVTLSAQEARYPRCPTRRPPRARARSRAWTWSPATPTEDDSTSRHFGCCSRWRGPRSSLRASASPSAASSSSCAPSSRAQRARRSSSS